jgi:hypothetical protein
VLSAAEHAAVHEETKRRRNAHARALRFTRKAAALWVQAVGAEVQRWDHHGEWRWTIRVPGFHPVTSDTLERAVRTLDATITHFVESRATHGPTGASLLRLRALWATRPWQER